MNAAAAGADKRAAAAAPRLLPRGSMGGVLLQTTQSVCVLPAATQRQQPSGKSNHAGQPSVLSRVILRDAGRTVAAGIILGVGEP